MTYIYQPYPRRLYLHGEVIAGDLHAANSVVVENESEESEARAKGYRKAYETNGGNGGSSAPVSLLSPDQGSVAATSADPIDALRAEAESLGIKVDRRWSVSRLKSEISKSAS